MRIASPDVGPLALPVGNGTPKLSTLDALSLQNLGNQDKLPT